MLSLLFALLIDALFAEPPTRVHPVVFMGKYLTWMKSTWLNNLALMNNLTWLKVRTIRSSWYAFWQGLGLLMLGFLVLTGCVFLILFGCKFLPNWLGIVLLAVLLKPMFSVRALLSAGESVKQALLAKNIQEARRLLSWNLVSRDTAQLSEVEVAGAAVSSLAENITDSIIAPLFYFVLLELFGLGLLGAVLYRFANTADAMLGYRTRELEYFGKAAARLDDLLNFIPARLTSALLFFALGLLKKEPYKGLNVALSAATPSPNGGKTMGMVAGGLDICLEKKGVYILNSSGKEPSAQSIAGVQRLGVIVTVLFWGVFTGLFYGGVLYAY